MPEDNKSVSLEDLADLSEVLREEDNLSFILLASDGFTSLAGTSTHDARRVFNMLVTIFDNNPRLKRMMEIALSYMNDREKDILYRITKNQISS